MRKLIWEHKQEALKTNAEKFIVVVCAPTSERKMARKMFSHKLFHRCCSDWIALAYSILYVVSLPTPPVASMLCVDFSSIISVHFEQRQKTLSNEYNLKFHFTPPDTTQTTEQQRSSNKRDQRGCVNSE